MARPLLSDRTHERWATHRVAPTMIFSAYLSHWSFWVVNFSHYLLAFTETQATSAGSLRRAWMPRAARKRSRRASASRIFASLVA